MTVDDAIVQERLRLILTRIVDLAVSINSHIAAATLGQAPATYRESFGTVARAGAISEELAIDLAPSAGLRNVLTHEYVTVDLSLVARAVPLAHVGFRRYVAEVARYIVGQTPH